jgi:hypothetical protein
MFGNPNSASNSVARHLLLGLYLFLLMRHDPNLMGESAMKFWEALAIGFRRQPEFCSQAPYEKLPLCSCLQNEIVARRERHSDSYLLSNGSPNMRDTNVVDFLEFRGRRREQIRTSSLAEHALDECEEAFRRSDWPRFGYWHAVFLRERNRLRDSKFSGIFK